MAQRRLFEDVADSIRRMIQNGSYPLGTRLPGERELSQQFGVSRVTIREAEIALQAAGWIHIRTGAGAYVGTEISECEKGQPQVGKFEVAEARSLFEGEAAALAALTIGSEILEKLDQLLASMNDDKASQEEIRAIHHEFHRTVAAASNNKAVIHVIEALLRMVARLPGMQESRSSSIARKAEYNDVVKALRNHDARGARIAMRRHFNRLIESMLDETEEYAFLELRRNAAKNRERYMLSSKVV